LIEQYVFTYGEGGAYAGGVPWKTVATLDPRLVPGDKIVIERYSNRIFTVTDAGGHLDPSNHIDVFVGEMSLQKAMPLELYTPESAKWLVCKPLGGKYDDQKTSANCIDCFRATLRLFYHQSEEKRFTDFR
jgi:hypothetical protein